MRLPRAAFAAAILLGTMACRSMPAATPGPSIGAGNPYPLSSYTCADGTRLDVRLMGDRASVAVNGGAAVDLPSIGNDGTTFTNGRQTLTVVQGNLSWAIGRAAASACKAA